MKALTRKEFSISAGLAACAVAARTGFAQQTKDKEKAMNEIKLDPLPFAENALEPIISARTLSYHYAKHHAGYVKTLNDLIAGTEYEGKSLEEIIRLSNERKLAPVFNNAAQVWNHTFYWNSLSAKGCGVTPSAELAKAIDAAFGSLDACKNALADTCIKRFGSGWGWLVLENGKISVESTSNAETPITRPTATPLLVVDVWEHAYYLDWQNARANHVKAVVGELLNWEAASKRFASC
jgi:Fe-Mn family superoxide dismutase